MIDATSEGILGLIDHAPESYYRLIVVAAPAGHGKTRALRHIAQRGGFRYIDVGLELSGRLLDLTERQRTLQASHILDEIAGAGDEQVVLLDNIELLFDVSLKLDPLRCLRGAARQRTLVVAWNGTVRDGHLTYAIPGHPEYTRYSVDDLTVVIMGEDA